MTLRKKIEVMQAFARGEEVEYRDRLNDMWFDSNFPAWNWREVEYRIKPKQKQVVVIEKWLCSTDVGRVVLEMEQGVNTAESIKENLLDTYEVTL